MDPVFQRDADLLLLIKQQQIKFSCSFFIFASRNTKSIIEQHYSNKSYKFSTEEKSERNFSRHRVAQKVPSLTRATLESHPSLLSVKQIDENERAKNDRCINTSKIV